MNYYRIRHSTDRKIVGKFTQINEVKHRCRVDDKRFIDSVFFEKASFDPITSIGILDKKAKITDLISTSGQGYTAKLLTSGKLKSLIEIHQKSGLEFFKSPIIYGEEELDDYWVMSPFETHPEFINYKDSHIQSRRRKAEGGTILVDLEVGSYRDFNELQKRERVDRNILQVSKIKLIENLSEHFFILRSIEGGFGYFVSEKMKNDMVAMNITGVAFQPSHLTFNEWVAL